MNRLTAIAIASLLLSGCSDTSVEERGVGSVLGVDVVEPREVQSKPLMPRDAGGSTQFQRIPAGESGIDFVHRWEPKNKLERDQIATAFAGGAVALGDIDNDGLPEVFLTRPHGGARLYRNLGDLKFKDVTEEAGIAGALADHWSSGATFVDIQGDGYLDLYVCGYAIPNRLFINSGNGQFEESAARYGLAFSGASVMMSFADYDRDGDLDAHLLTNRLSGQDRPEGLEFKIVDGKVIAPERYRDEVGAVLKNDGSLHPFDAGQADRLFRNDSEPGQGPVFTDVTVSAGMIDHSQGLSATWWDYNSDGWNDLYVANDFFGSDHLYRNNHDGTFSDVIARAVPNTPWFSMGSDAGDLNGDGLLDFIAADMAATTHLKQKLNMGDMDAEGWFLETPIPRQYMRNAVYINTGTPRFLEVGQMAGLSATEWTWAVKIADFDSDGLNDAFFSNGMTRDFFNADVRAEVREIRDRTGENRWSDYPPLRERNRLFQNRGDLNFAEVSREWGMGDETVSFGAATGDLDGDGDLDLVVNNFESEVDLFRNTSVTGNLIKLALRGSGSNHYAIGAEIKATTDKTEHVRVLQPVRGFLGCDPANVVFGLGEESMVNTLTIRWPSGKTQTLHDFAAGWSYIVSEAADALQIEAPPAERTLFSELRLLDLPRHVESDFDDFAVQPLLPNRLSTLGPAMAWGDLDGNGRPDCFLGGASGHPAQLWLQSDKGKLFRQKIPFFDAAAKHEDIDAAVFDADGDGDLDVYVVSGGVEGGVASGHYQDRLYLSVENGLTSAPSGTLPDMNFSGGCVAVGDLEGDGDRDLFIGARVIPGKYPMSSPSRLLINEPDADGNVRFVDAPPEVTSTLVGAGMVTDAIWRDVDSDGDLDLMATTEYGPVRSYRNDGGRLVETTAAAGLADRLGWWNCIASADVDADGDLDFAVGNFGLNTKYHPDKERPQFIYYGDFDGRGRAHIVEAHPIPNQNGNSADIVPNRGRSCSSGAMPFIKEKFGTFHSFATASLAEIYSATKLESSIKLEVNELATGILLNDGTGKFEFKPLPRSAQIAPCFGLAFLEVDGDGKTDLYVSQNFYGPQRETGRMAGGVGVLLLGASDGTFSEVSPDKSGIVVPGDARGVVSIDFDADGYRDLAVTVNDGPVRIFIDRGSERPGGE